MTRQKNPKEKDLHTTTRATMVSLCKIHWTSAMAQQIKNLPAIQEIQETCVGDLYIVFMLFLILGFFAAKAKNFLSYNILEK